MESLEATRDLAKACVLTFVPLLLLLFFIFPLGTAGGGAVHGIGGMAALVGATIIGPRIGRFHYDDETRKWISTPIPGHNLVLAALGIFLLWFGFFAFNGGSGTFQTQSKQKHKWIKQKSNSSLVIPFPTILFRIVTRIQYCW